MMLLNISTTNIFGKLELQFMAPPNTIPVVQPVCVMDEYILKDVDHLPTHQVYITHMEEHHLHEGRICSYN